VTHNRRDFVKGAAAVPIFSASSISIEWSREFRVVRPTSLVEIQNVIHECHRQNKALSNNYTSEGSIAAYP